MAITREDNLCGASLGALGAATLGFEHFGLVQALAQSRDYKALVCIFLFGGNDAGNMIIPYDDYSAYAAVRQSAGLAIPQSNLLPIDVPRLGSRFALHPSLTGLQQLWLQGKLAAVCNVGPLIESTSRDSYINGTRPSSIESLFAFRPTKSVADVCCKRDRFFGMGRADGRSHREPEFQCFAGDPFGGGNTDFCYGTNRNSARPCSSTHGAQCHAKTRWLS